MKKGFTLIEVLISLVILSIIAIVSTNFLQSSIDLRNQSKSKVDDIKVFNLGVSTIRRDLMSVVNLPMRDNFGNQLPNFIGSNADKKITFLGFINRIDSSRSSISRIEYLFNDLKFFQPDIPACQASYKSGTKLIIKKLCINFFNINNLINNLFLNLLIQIYVSYFQIMV